ncbi:MAG: hypothetical protein KIT80_03380 [Chitinophagaceae bacterium]|nr:hypothetical protein [Chitinophagaceae bacterium]MCW5925928.1 hypothetical protein [Chitinophagaceae bacterium]
MSKSYKLWTGILSIIPFILFLLYMGWFFTSFAEVMVTAINQEQAPVETAFIKSIMGVAMIAIVMGLVTLAAIIVFIINAANNKSIESAERIMWILLFVFVGMIAFPLYWFLRIKNAPTKEPVT